MIVGRISSRFSATESTDSANATVTINVASVNDLPVAGADTLSTTEDTALPLTLTGADIEGDALATIDIQHVQSCGRSAAHGSLVAVGYL